MGLRLKSTSSDGIEAELESKIRTVLNANDLVRIDNAFRLCAERRIGQPLTSEDIASIAKRTDNTGIAARLCADVSATKERQSYLTLAVACFGLCSAMQRKRGSDSKQATVVLGCYFLQRFLADTDNMLALVVNSKTPVETKIVRLFLSWWSTLPDSVFDSAKEKKSESSTVRVTFKQDKKFGSGNDCRRHLVCKSGTVVGCIRWDDARGNVSAKRYGWVTTLFDGFNETAYRTGKGESSEPFTAVHKGEVKLHNPTRMSLDLAKTWVRNALRTR